jgi:hypothetical protein
VPTSSRSSGLVRFCMLAAGGGIRGGGGGSRVVPVELEKCGAACRGRRSAAAKLNLAALACTSCTYTNVHRRALYTPSCCCQPRCCRLLCAAGLPSIWYAAAPTACTHAHGAHTAHARACVRRARRIASCVRAMVRVACMKPGVYVAEINHAYSIDSCSSRPK